MSSKSELRAQEFRNRAAAASAFAEACVLDRTRELHERAALRWLTLAEDEERRTFGLGA